MDWGRLFGDSAVRDAFTAHCEAAHDVEHVSECSKCNNLRRVLEAALRGRMLFLQDLVEKQAKDDGLWFESATAPEAYLQQALRQLHAELENVSGKQATQPQ